MYLSKSKPCVMSVISCPECKKITEKGKYNTWQILVAICLFPIGLFALLAERKPTKCNSCNYIWQA
tara:strand:+ start:170 stop:367 length:198 start_codon:yes stop_codon:yes gene_type:complete